MQIPESNIRYNCMSGAAQRAHSIAAKPSMFADLTQDKSVLRGVERTVLTGYVLASDRINEYRVEVYLDERAGEVVSYECTCPAQEKYPGMCKHAAALIMRYNECPGAFALPAGSHLAGSSPALVAFMQHESNVSDEKMLGPIELVPKLSCYFGAWSVQFRIGVGNTLYALRSISGFVNDMELGNYISYGKKLAFAHELELLSPRSQQIYHVLKQAVDRRLSEQRRSHWVSSVGAALDLRDDEAVALFDALLDTQVAIEDRASGASGAAMGAQVARVVQQDPDLGLAITEVEGGYTISAAERFCTVYAQGRLYVWAGATLNRTSRDFARLASVLGALAEEGELFVAASDCRQFACTVLPLLEKCAPALQVPESLAIMRPVACRLAFYFDKLAQGVVCDAKAVYGAFAFPLMNETFDIEGAPPRDKAAEEVGRALVNRYLPLRGPVAGVSEAALAAPAKRTRARHYPARTPINNRIDPLPFIEIADDEGILGLVFGGLAQFRAIGDVYTTAAFDKLLFDKKPQVKTGLTISGNLINLDVAADELDAAELAALLGSYRRRKHYHRLRSGAFLDLRDMDLEAIARVVDDLGISDKQLASGSIELPAYQAFYLDSQLEDADRSTDFSAYVANFDRARAKARRVPAQLAATLRPYQREGFEWLSLLADCGFGGILADEMGLGKSVQLITWLLSTRSAARKVGPNLVVCPASLVFNWLAEFERFAPSLVVHAMVGSKAERARVREMPADVIVTSYDLMRIDAAALTERTFFSCTLDEAQYIKNHTTKTAQAARRIKADHRFALTGTPMENRPGELWSIFGFLMPGLLGSAMRFRENFEVPILGNDAAAAERLRALVGPFILRRRKADVLADLPEKLEDFVYTQMQGEQLKLYRAHEQNLRDALNDQKRLTHSRGRRYGTVKDGEINKVEVLAELTKLRQLCLDPGLLYDNYKGAAAKLDTIGELVSQGIDAGQKILVFSQFTSFLARIADRLAAAGVAYYTITGTTPKKRRLDLVNQFNTDDVPVFLISLKAGGTGLNLTGASIVIHADPWWNEAAQNQATDRAHRIGQTRAVSVYKVVATGTIEERIVRLQKTKADMANALVEGSGLSLAAMTTEDLASLLG